MSFLIASDGGFSPAYFRSATERPASVIVTDYQDARVLTTPQQAAEAHRKWCEVLRDTNPDNDRWPTIVPVTHIPATPEFEAAVMLSSDNIPTEGAEVKLIWRNGATRGVSLGFLRGEMLQGRLIRDPDFCRYFAVSRHTQYIAGCLYVGTSADPKHPGIISGPFTVPPRLTGPNHTLWRAAGGKFVREENLEFH